MYKNVVIKTLAHSLGSDYHIRTYKGYVTIYKNITDEISIKITNVNEMKNTANICLSHRLQPKADLINYIRFDIPFSDLISTEKELLEIVQPS